MYSLQGSDESLGLPEVLLVRADDLCTLSGVELDGQPTCAFVVCRNDYHRVKQLLEEEEISNIRCCVGNCKVRLMRFIIIIINLLMHDWDKLSYL